MSVTCWCGAELADDDASLTEVAESCDGGGVVPCYCGGDLCVCHNHGEIACVGCHACRSSDAYSDWGDTDTGTDKEGPDA